MSDGVAKLSIDGQTHENDTEDPLGANVFSKNEFERAFNMAISKSVETLVVKLEANFETQQLLSWPLKATNHGNDLKNAGHH